MKNEIDKILDDCIDRVNRGESVEGCLRDYPEHRQSLAQLLDAVVATQQAYSFTPSAEGKRQARKRLYDSIEKARKSREKSRTLFQRPRLWAFVTTVVGVILIAIVALNIVESPIVPNPNPEGNFVFLISDEENAINDFSSLALSISSIELRMTDSGDQVEFEPLVSQAELTELIGDNSLEIWQGDIPVGDYNKVFVYVDSVIGILADTDESIEIKLPSNKLQISIPFTVSDETTTYFTFDVTVVAAGNDQSGVKYILKPQVDESGVVTE